MAQHSGIIEREIQVEATPDVVYRVVSTPEHLREWWSDDADLEPAPGANGTVSFGDRSRPEEAKVVALTVVEADPPRRFSFRWVYDEGVTPAPDNSLLVTFDLVPNDAGTLVRFTETGFADRGWDPALAEATVLDHTAGWAHFLPRLTDYVARLTPTS